MNQSRRLFLTGSAAAASLAVPGLALAGGKSRHDSSAAGTGLRAGALAWRADDDGGLEVIKASAAWRPMAAQFSVLDWRCSAGARPAALDLRVSMPGRSGAWEQPIPVQLWSYRDQPVACEGSANGIQLTAHDHQLSLLRREPRSSAAELRWYLPLAALTQRAGIWVIADLGQPNYQTPDWSAYRLISEDDGWVIQDRNGQAPSWEYLIAEISHQAGEGDV